MKGRPTTVKGTTLQHKTNVTATPDTGIKPPKTKSRKTGVTRCENYDENKKKDIFK
jgi:hypothetical protein